MLLSEADIRHLEKAGHVEKEFVRFDSRGLAQLRNERGYCVFYEAEKQCCRIYRFRPSGCRIYPIIYSEEEGVIVDDLCPMKNTVTKAEMERYRRRLHDLLKRIDEEAERRASATRSANICFNTKVSKNLK
jgi:Fe-S-cluster containining protein